MSKPNKSPVRGILLIWLIATLVLPALGWAAKGTAKTPESRMSSMGRLAARAVAAIHASGGRTIVLKSGEGCDNEPDCEDEDADGPAGGQAETSIAVDSTGQHIVVGFNDTRGFALNPLSVSGFAYSDDGGQT